MIELEHQAHEFAKQLTETVQFVAGPDTPGFAATAVLELNMFRVAQVPESGVVLCDETGPLLRLAVEYMCTWDGYERYLAVDRSKIHVFVEPNGRQPLFRYEFDRRTTDALPSAHIHFHGEHSELEAAMRACGESTARAKRRRRGKTKSLLTDLHFPVGGTRFRPCLEDVMQMVIEEFGITPRGGPVATTYRQLAERREHWRRLQIATSVRDAPATAARVLILQRHSRGLVLVDLSGDVGSAGG
ncbi:hypothetical protein AB0C34_11545 [Nocardia sp. NPDC049220]|uniref:hypothetical protein n=1 Tax=Nocardia sp. NPDC049220 TaxID=3155273 RepID=UPI0033C901AF